METSSQKVMGLRRSGEIGPMRKKRWGGGGMGLQKSGGDTLAKRVTAGVGKEEGR